MQSKYIVRQGNPRLLLIFAGWGMDWRPFRNLQKHGYDIMVVWDYRSLDINWHPVISAYADICLLAWSMGVFAASLTAHQLLPRITKRIAVNGTLTPIHDRLGIPEAIFDGTLRGLSPTSLRKFYRRMCLTAQQFAAFMADKPKRDIDELIDELHSIETLSILHTEQITQWDLAVISRHDAVFSAVNQAEAWRGLAPVQMMDAAHLPDFAMLISRLFIDKQLVSERFEHAASTYSEQATVQDAAAARLLEYARQCDVTELTGSVLEIGSGRGTLTRRYAGMLRPDTRLTLWDIAPGAPADAPEGSIFECCDAETAIRQLPDNSRSFILSANTVQWFNSPASFLRECQRVLTPGGYIIISTYAHGNLPELYGLLGNGLHLPTCKAWEAMTAAHLDVLKCAESINTIYFETPRMLLDHLRETGVNAVDYGRNPVALARHILQHLRPADDGTYPLSYRPVYIVARKSLD